MHARLAEVFAYLDEQHDRLRATYEAVPPALRDRRPSDDAWSPAEVVSHLVLIERRLAPTFTTVISKAREAGVPAEHQVSSILPSIDLALVEDRSRKLTAPAPVDPRTASEPLGWDAYERARADLKAAFLTGDGLALGEILHPHPRFGPLNLYQWIGFVGAHASRHAAQIREAAEAGTQ